MGFNGIANLIGEILMKINSRIFVAAAEIKNFTVDFGGQILYGFDIDVDEQLGTGCPIIVTIILQNRDQYRSVENLGKRRRRNIFRISFAIKLQSKPNGEEVGRILGADNGFLEEIGRQWV